MFKELGAFIDEAGRSTGRVIKGLLSDKDDKDDDGMMGLIPDTDDFLENSVVHLPDDKDEDKSEVITIRIDD